MNLRDPLKLRDTTSASDYLRNSASVFQQRAVQSSRRLLSTVQDTRKKFDDPDDLDTTSSLSNEAHGTAMSYALPHSGPTQRHHVGNANGDTSSGIGEKMSSYFAGERKSSLPMYKDKPFQYPASSRSVPWFRKRRILAVVLVVVVSLSWWFGVFSLRSREKTAVEDVEKSQHLEHTAATTTTTWFGGRGIDWQSRAESVKDTFRMSWAGYEKYAWGYDEFSPKSKTYRQMTDDGLGWIIVDAIDTMMLMNLSAELIHARQWLSNHTYDQDHDVNTFETTIRMLGGLLSAHYLSTSFDGKYAPVSDGLSEDLYLEKATDLADRLLGAYESGSGVPFASVNLHTRQGIPSHADGGASSTAEATTLQLEMKFLAKLTGEQHYWKQAEKVMEVIDNNNARDGLVPIYIYADRGTYREANIRLGSRGDSYYEYLAKQWLQTQEQEPAYHEMWNQSLTGIKKHLLTYSSPSNFLVPAERPNGLMGELSPKMDHLVCFLPGTIALAATGGATLAEARKSKTWGPQQEEDMEIAEELMKTCWGMYKVTPTGLAPEIAHFNLYNPPKMYNDFITKTRPKSPEDFTPSNSPDFKGEFVGQDDYDIHPGDRHNLQRPETIESMFYMWRITGNEKYRHWGWEMFQSFIKWTAVEDGTGFSSVSDVTAIPPPSRDNMESFWLAETLKYFYLLFGSNDIMPLTDVVFNTEAHPFPRFPLNKLLKTGWKRKARDAEGNFITPSSESNKVITDVKEAKVITDIKEAKVITDIKEAAQVVTRVVEQVITSALGEEATQTAATTSISIIAPSDILEATKLAT